jgi:PAS domain-containing protein
VSNLVSNIKGRREFENRALRRIFGTKRDELTGGLRKLNNEELHNFYYSRSTIRIIKSRRMTWAGNVTRMGRKGMQIELGGKKEGKRPLRRPRNRWVDNIKMDLRERDYGVAWTGLI